MIDVPAELAWSIAAAASPWVADTGWARTVNRARVALKHSPFTVWQHGYRWSAVRHRWRPGDLVAADRRRRRHVEGAGGQPDRTVVPDQHHHPHPQSDRRPADRGGHGRHRRRGDHRRGAHRRLRPGPVSRSAVLPGQQRPDRRGHAGRRPRLLRASSSTPARPRRPTSCCSAAPGREYNHLTLSWVYDWMAQGVPVVAMHRSTSWNTTEGLRIDTGMYLHRHGGDLGPQGHRRRQAGARGFPGGGAAGSASIPTRCTWSATTSTTTCWRPRWSA